MLELNEKQIAKIKELQQVNQTLNALLVGAHKEGIEIRVESWSTLDETEAHIHIGCRLT